MNRDNWRQFAVIFTTVLTLVMNTLATTLPLNGVDTGAISDRWVNFFTPAGYVFAIWGVIYTGLIAFTVYHSLPSQKENSRLRAIGWIFVVSNLFNSAWIVAWHYFQITLSWVLMLGILATLLTIYIRIGTGIKPTSRRENWLINVPFSIYTAWITVATIANTTVLLQNLGWEGAPLSAPFWSAFVIIVGALITSFVVYTRRDIAFAGVVIWAYVGIVVKYAGTPLVVGTAGAMAAAVLIVLIASFVRTRPSGGQLQSSPA